ncbi:non-ribosomal peptide synthetase [Paenibacillus apiarius]|uniref:Amino acid adenylation domain-containing protein n=1 Tax=Paenibacillus apiarius TaxID=46240 RepID=A0ABT4DNE4_9BACL|nr:non-ribosomal peptide synthetase [Paenibacillus apiarius]MCY9513729.1 amino acid adenylation domain-containing protein [Paenibacillus apiarius]MCY9518280.1 amino acid adenylation domain-containing protein [Paenibacillus apiarius]MCY9551319.1 amino acid adenylation domain-containing protein [Paenibacillus apiarius]MCY9558473.1 amino acid adenylation domain-containing protein [Paenibacillus apiarius]MCY9684213.1 amino acid adenylation domain-containing protein [Paenibacillus apiarius]
MGSENRLDRLAVAASQKSKEREYWMAALSGEYDKSGFPCDYGRGTGMTAEEVSFCLPQELTARLLQVCAGSDSKLHVVLSAALFALLAKMTNRSDIAVGTPIYKQREEAEFINAVLPLRANVDVSLSFRQCLLQMQDTIVAAVEHQSYPMELVAEQLALPADDPIAHPLFETALLLSNIHDERYFRNVKWTTLFSFRRTEDGIDGVVKYNAQLFRSETIASLVSRYTLLLREVLANPDQPLQSIHVLLPGEKERLLGPLAGCSSDYPQEQSVQRLFEEQAARTPDAAAVVSRDGQLTYGELNEKANQLARTLRGAGIEAGDIVGVLLAPSADMMIGMIATLKAGGAFLPIDPDYPDERIAFMLKDSRARVVLTQRPFAERTAGREALCLDDAGLFAGGTENVARDNRPDDLAYVIYTSGSTGQPKGVMIEHRALVNLAFWHNRAFGVAASDRSIKYAGFGFDASVWEVFPYLLAGAAIHIVPSDIRLDAHKLDDFFAEHGITIAFLPTMMCEQFMDLPDRKQTPLRILLTGGDRLNRYAHGSYRLFNNYGPTENTVVTTFAEIKTEAGGIPIGRPIDNTKVYVLDRHLQLLPPGVPGEICVAGAGLARGYLGRPELTAEKFVPHPFVPGERLYRTGDLGRWLPDGTLEYWGRQDDQVKVRGYRIEPGEIEMLLRRHEEVREAVIQVREDENGQNMLCAYYTGPAGLSAAELRDHLAVRLPAYMIPAYFVRLEQLPVTANGKLDTKALPNPKERVHTGKQYVAPRGVIENTLVRIWADVLAISEDKVGVLDTFFDLGGNSFQIVQVVNKLKEAFDRDIPVPVLFQYTTVAALGDYLQRLESGEAHVSQDMADNEEIDAGFETMEQTLLILEGAHDD